MERKAKEYVGTVVSSKNNKTITVQIDTFERHRLYSKRVRRSKKYAVHDESNKAKVGDVVKIVETKPISKTKRFYLKEIVKEAVIL